MKRAFYILACSAACLTAPAIAQADTSFNLDVALYKSNGKVQPGGAGDNRLVLSLVKGF